MRLFIVILITILCGNAITVCSQPEGNSENVWSLQRCVQYALTHNISIRRDSLNARLARYTLLQSQLSQLPSLNVNGSYGKNLGRSINPATNQFVDASYNFANLSGNSNLLLFGWMQVRNTIARNRYLLDAALADLDQLKDDISVNVATAFLTALLAKEQVNVSANQVKLTQEQYKQTKAFADAGRLPELNVAQLESQLATDSANLVNSIAGYNSAILDLKTLLNLDFATSLDLQTPQVGSQDQLNVSVMQPDEIFKEARTHFGSIKGSQMRVRSAEKGLAAAKGGLYPQLSLGYQVGSIYASNYQTVSTVPSGLYSRPYYIQDTIANTPIFGPAQSIPITTFTTTPFNDQLSNNFRQSVFLGVNIPLFNGWQSQYALRQARINLDRQRLEEYNAELTLKQKVYKAHNDAINAIQKYNAAKRADDAATRALEYASKRYDLGLTSTVDLLVTKNQQFAAASNMVSAKYDLIFKLKVIDYYLGKELKL
ncbi:MAG: transporter [Flavipsychrobacter sp.]|jgi:outer membrane protein|nr:transporter [Flavipsychrobacter sp.]